MFTHTFYIHTISGDIATLDSWRSDYDSMDIESWHGKPAEECNSGDWIKDGKLEPIKLTGCGVAFLTDRVFPGWFGDVSDGEKYQSEWASYAEDRDGNLYMIFWNFPAVKGEEPEDGGAWPWYDNSYISRIETL